MERDLADWEYRGHAKPTNDINLLFSNLLNAVKDTTSLTKSIIEEHFDINSMLGYILFCQIAWCSDSLINNWTLCTWDGIKWYHIMYDLDICFGMIHPLSNPDVNGDIFTCPQGKTNDLLSTVNNLYNSEIASIYTKWRKHGFTSHEISQRFVDFQNKWGFDAISSDKSIWANAQQTTVQYDADKIETWLSERLSFLDSKYGYNNDTSQKENTKAFSTDFINALSAFMDGVAFTSADGQTLKQNVLNAMNASNTSTLYSISVTYNGGTISVGTNIDELKSNLIVKANYSDGTSKNVTGYTFDKSEIEEGDNVITVTYQGKSATFTVVGKKDSTPSVYGISLAWQGVPEYAKWSTNENWYTVHYNEDKAAIQIGNGFKAGKVYSKAIDGKKYKYLRVPGESSDKQYSIYNNVFFYGSDSPNALTEEGHQITKCTQNKQFVSAEFDSNIDGEGIVIVYPSEDYDYYYIEFQTNNSLTSTYPDLLGIFDENIIKEPLANATE